MPSAGCVSGCPERESGSSAASALRLVFRGELDGVREVIIQDASVLGKGERGQLHASARPLSPNGPWCVGFLFAPHDALGRRRPGGGRPWCPPLSSFLTSPSSSVSWEPGAVGWLGQGPRSLQVG